MPCPAPAIRLADELTQTPAGQRRDDADHASQEDAHPQPLRRRWAEPPAERRAQHARRHVGGEHQPDDQRVASAELINGERRHEPLVEGPHRPGREEDHRCDWHQVTGTSGHVHPGTKRRPGSRPPRRGLGTDRDEYCTARQHDHHDQVDQGARPRRVLDQSTGADRADGEAEHRRLTGRNRSQPHRRGRCRVNDVGREAAAGQTGPEAHQHPADDQREDALHVEQHRGTGAQQHEGRDGGRAPADMAGEPAQHQQRGDRADEVGDDGQRDPGVAEAVLGPVGVEQRDGRR